MRPLTIARMCCLAAALSATPAAAQAPDTILVNGKILTVDARFSTREALAIRDGRIVALDTSANIRKLAGRETRVIDVQGRTVIPGLIDSHLHAIRAAQTFATEVNWIGAASLSEALGRISEAARTMKPGAWLIVAGGWNVQQFKENRRPTQAELVGRRAQQPCLRAARLRLGDADAAGLQGPEHHDRRRRAVGRKDGTRRERQADGRYQRRPGRDHRAVRQAAETDVRRAGGRHEEVLPRAQPSRPDRRRTIPAGTTSPRTITRRCSRSGGGAR